MENETLIGKTEESLGLPGASHGPTIVRYLPLIVYIIISVVWIMIFAIAGVVFANSTLSIFLSILWVIIYIPLIVYYISRGETMKAWYIVVFTFLTTLIYLVYVTTWLLAELTRRTIG